jgi:hypothetical protein
LLLVLLLAVPLSSAGGAPESCDMVVVVVEKRFVCVCVCVGRWRREVRFTSEGSLWLRRRGESLQAPWHGIIV